MFDPPEPVADGNVPLASDDPPTRQIATTPVIIL
jgi:hypothetical protein